MNDHYYTESPNSQSRPAEARFDYRGRAFTLISDAGVFSRGELDSGTRILLSALPDRLQGRVLDLGCGWGPVGVALGLCLRGGAGTRSGSGKDSFGDISDTNQEFYAGGDASAEAGNENKI